MFLFDLFRSFLPLHNPIGFGAVDFIEMALAILLAAFALLWRAPLELRLRALGERTAWCMACLALLPIVLRLLLLPHNPIPSPNVSDDFSYVLLADTLRHFRLANPPHALPQFFETYFAVQQPSYSSIFPLGQGLALAFGWLLFGHPWAGVALSTGALCALCFWMLRGWTTPGWSLLGGLLAVVQFGPLNQWMNSFWGGAVAGCAGCLVFGALPRLRRNFRRRDAALLGVGLAVHLLTRPYESIFLVCATALFFGNRPRVLLRSTAIASFAVIPALGLILLHNHSVTGEWTQLPYQLSRYQYGVPTTFTFDPIPRPHRELTPQQKLHYDVQSQVHGEGTDTLWQYLSRLGGRLLFYRFFFLPPLYLALPFFLWRLRERRFAWAAGTIILFALGTNFYPYFYTHYIAALTCVFVLAAVAALERLARFNRECALIVIFFCTAHFVFWYSLHLFAGERFAADAMRYETWDAINSGDPLGRLAVNRQLSQAGGQNLVFVRYASIHKFHEWVHNAADIDASPTVWARDLGPEENQKLRDYYPRRRAWLLEADALPPRLIPYQPKPAALFPAPPQPEARPGRP